MKTTLLAFLLTGAGLAAQTSAPPTFSPLPTPSSSSGSSSARQPFYRVPSMGTNVAAQPAATVPPTNFASPFPKAQPGSVPATAAPTVPSSAPITRGPVTGPPPVVNPTQPGATVPPGVAQPGTAHGGAPAEPMVQAGEINFPATDLNQVLQIYGELVGKTILRPTSLPAPTITLKTQTPLTRSEAIEAFKAVLWLNGIAVEDFGDKFVKVVPTANAGNVGAPFSTNAVDKMPEMGQFITHIVQLTNTKPSELVQVLQPLASPGVTAGIFPIDTSQILVLRDSTENVKRMLELIKKVDVTVPSEYISEVIPIKYAMATDLANALSSLGSGGSATTVGSAAGGGARGAGGGYSRAGGYRSGYGGTSGYGGYPGSSYGGMGGMGTTPYGSITPMSVGEIRPMAISAPGMPGAQQPGGSFGDRLRNIISKASKEGEINVLGQTKIIADERTNSLLIFATREDMKIIKDIVSKLDVVLAQVLIEAAIVQVSLDDSHDFGISYLQKSPSHPGNYFSGIGAINNNNILNGSSFVTSGAGTNIAGNLPSGFSYLASLNNDLDVSITALASSTRAKILQRPRIQTSHAVPATLFVGEQRPYPVSSYYGGGAFGGYASIQQLQIGVTIEVTPLINPDGLVVMDIHTKIDSFEGNVTIQNVGDVPVTSSKDASAKVAVRDHDTIMLGGLIETTKNSNNSGVPFLKDIPGLGYLFRSSSAENQRTELIVLIRPTVLPTPEVAALAARAEKDRMPGVRSVEREIQSEESKRLRDADKASKVKNQ